MTSVRNRVIATTLSVLLATSPLLGCGKAAQNKNDDPQKQDDMAKDDEQENQGKTVPYNKKGEYTVTLQEGDFTKGEDEGQASDDDAANKNDAPNADEQAKPESDNAANDEAKAELEQAEEGVTAAEQKVQELTGTADQNATTAAETQAEEKQDKKALTFDDLKLENVKVYYDTITNREALEADESGEVEPQFEVHEAQAKALSNDNGAITLSFVDPDAATNAPDTYYVVIDDLRLYAPIHVDMAQPMLTTESSVTCDSTSADVTIKAEDGTFDSDISASDLKLGGSFRGMTVTGAEASGDTLTVHLSGTPVINYKVSSVYMDGQITVPASGFENSAYKATAYVPVDLPEGAFDLGKAEALAPATAIGDVDYATIDGDTGKATVLLQADLGSFNDVKPESITLEDGFAGGKVESVSKEGEDGDVLKVEVSFPTNGASEDDYSLAGTIKFATGAMTDENGNAAPEVESTVTVSSDEDMGKAAEEKKKEKDPTEESLATVSVGLKYTQKWVKKVDPTLAKITGFYGSVLDIAGGIYTGKWSKALESGLGMLKLVGIDPEEKEVTAEDVLKEVKGLRSVVNSIDAKVSDIAKENREDRFTQTSVRLKMMQDECASIEAMYREGARLLATRKQNPMKTPGEKATNEEIAKYNDELRSLMLKEQKKAKDGDEKSSMFIDLDSTVEKLRENLSQVTKWVSIQKGSFNEGANPIDVYDKLVSSRFNWDTQGYYARVSFRGELTYTMSTAWAAISTYYNTNDPKVKSKYQAEADSVTDALEQVEARPAGMSPDQARELNQAGKDIKVYSPSLGFTIKRCRLVNGGVECSQNSDERTGNDKINEYKRRLQGSLYEELQLAGLETGDENTKFDGIGFRHHIEWTRHRTSRRAAWFAAPAKVYYDVEAWTLMMFQDKSASAKKTFLGTRDTNKQVKGDKWYTFYWFDRA